MPLRDQRATAAKSDCKRERFERIATELQVQ
jgi:hypothetical protein